MSETTSAASNQAQPTATPTAPAAPTTQQRADARGSRQKLAETADRIFGAPRDEEPATAPVASPADQPAPQAEQAAAALEAKGAPVPEQKPGESDHAYGMRLAQTLRRVQQLEADLLGQRKGRETAEARARELEALVEAAKKDPLKALELAGVDFDKLAQDVIEGKVRKPDPVAKLPPEVQAELDALREASKKLAEREETERKAAAREQDLSVVRQALEQTAADFPLLAALPGVHERVLNDLYAELEQTGRQPDMVQAFTRIQSAILRDAKGLLGSTQVARLLCEDPQIRDTFAKALGGAREQAQSVSPTSDEQGTQGSGDGPRALSSNVVSEVPSYQRRQWSDKETKARLLKATDAIFGT